MTYTIFVLFYSSLALFLLDITFAKYLFFCVICAIIFSKIFALLVIKNLMKKDFSTLAPLTKGVLYKETYLKQQNFKVTYAYITLQTIIWIIILMKAPLFAVMYFFVVILEIYVFNLVRKMVSKFATECPEFIK